MADIGLYLRVIRGHQTPDWQVCELVAYMWQQQPDIKAFSKMSPFIQNTLLLMLSGV